MVTHHYVTPILVKEVHRSLHYHKSLYFMVKLSGQHMYVYHMCNVTKVLKIVDHQP